MDKESLEQTTLGDFKFEKRFCPACDIFEWHFQTLSGEWVCIGCRAKEKPEEFHHSPISAHCEDVLAHPPKCFDFAGIRSLVMCKAWAILEKEKRTKLPVSEAWQEARKVCERE